MAPHQHGKTLILFLGLGLLALSLGIFPPAQAATVWEDDFNDADYNGWVVETGSFTAAGNTLRCTSVALSAIQHPSTVASGTWSFDFVFTGAAHVSAVYFAIGVISDIMGNQGYQILFNNYGFSLQVITDSATDILDSYTAPDGVQGRQHIDITRDTGGLFRVYINGTLQMDATNTEHTTANYFLIHMFQDESIDNVVVSNTVDVTPTTTDPGTGNPTGPPPGIPGFPTAAIAIGLIISVILALIIRKRQSSLTPNPH